jgi:hypothetical protein
LYARADAFETGFALGTSKRYLRLPTSAFAAEGRSSETSP